MRIMMQQPSPLARKPVIFKVSRNGVNILYLRCLEMSSQTSVDYLKQILLSTMLKICQTHVSQNTGVERGKEVIRYEI
jgi:hypothetical protein